MTDDARPEAQPRKGCSSGCLKFFLIILAISVVFVGCSYLLDDGVMDYCADYMYDQGFRSDDLTTMIKACVNNPPPGAP